jgi:hypothetical protein
MRFRSYRGCRLGMRMDPAVRSGVFPADLHERADGGDLACGAMLTDFISILLSRQ